jgi:2-polyprenyl-3-methyl-5-hydroxy-6-metoxy-1,4-benzoquinol methylase
MSATDSVSHPHAFDRHKAETFATRVLTSLNGGAFCLMASIGHRTGLFDAMRDQPPMTTREIADRAGLDERYVREWLGAMATAGVVEVHPATLQFRLPPEHAAYLTRAAGADNMALFAQYIGVLAEVETRMVECFRHGGGLAYDQYPRLHAVMAEDHSVLASLESRLLPLIPGLAERLAHGIHVLDVGCGSGRVLNHLAELYPRSSFTGIDLSETAIGAARDEASRRGLQNVQFIARDLRDFDETVQPETFDLVMAFDAIHDHPKPLAVLIGIYCTLEADGVALIQEINGTSRVENDIDHPLATFLYTVSCLHCIPVSLAQGGEGVGAMWGAETTRAYLQRAGFRSVETYHFPDDLINNYYVVRK